MASFSFMLVLDLEKNGIGPETNVDVVKLRELSFVLWSSSIKEVLCCETSRFASEGQIFPLSADSSSRTTPSNVVLDVLKFDIFVALSSKFCWLLIVLR